MTTVKSSATLAWLKLLDDVLEGEVVAPRGKRTFERPQHTIAFDMRRPVVKVPERKLNPKFMVAEAHWILTGDSSVAGVAPWNSRIASFSDDGVSFFGAYGPKLIGQIDFVVSKLLEDRDTRQAVMTFWRENPPKTKDTPCTVALSFMIRNDKLNVHVFMRSNDIWLGTVYDGFNFSMIGHFVCAKYNEATRAAELPSVLAPLAGFVSPVVLEPGALFLTAASSHLYEEHWEAARALLVEVHDRSGTLRVASQGETPAELHKDSARLVSTLRDLRDSQTGDARRWWEA